MILVTDAMAGLSLPLDSRTNIGAEEVVIIEQRAFSGRLIKKAVKASDHKVLAGSVVTMLDAINNLRRYLPNTPWAHIIKAATINPARLLGIAKQRDLSVGAYADFLIIAGDFLEMPPTIVIEKTIIGGRIAYQAEFPSAESKPVAREHSRKTLRNQSAVIDNALWRGALRPVRN